MSQNQNWPRLVQETALRLLGEPKTKRKSELRYGEKGSLSIDLKRGVWRDHENDTGGGVLDLIARETGKTGADAMAWLEEQGLIVANNRQPRRDIAANAARPNTDRQKTETAAAALWHDAVADPGPIRAYLSARGVWNPATPLPDSVQWIGAGTVNRLRWQDPFPASAPGGMCAAWTSAAGDVLAVQVEALHHDGSRTTPRWRKSRGRMGGAAFRVDGPPDGPLDGPLAVAEGVADVLAIATWIGREAWATGSTGNMQGAASELIATGRQIEIHSDGDGAGRKAAQSLADRLRVANRQCRIDSAAEGSDPAQDLAEGWAERAALIECGEGCSRTEAETLAWQLTTGHPN